MQAKEKHLLIKALKNLGLKVEENASVQTYGDTHKCEIKAKGNTDEWRGICAERDGFYAIGFNKTPEGNYEMIADDMQSVTKHNSPFRQNLMQQYSKCAVEEQTQMMGWHVADETVDENGNIHMSLGEM